MHLAFENSDVYKKYPDDIRFHDFQSSFSSALGGANLQTIVTY
jgi:hypothetical protein